MKKVININFQGRVVMIEEAAYEDLKTYIESLRRHFAGEEGHEEIINDIESRVSELFEEVIKKGKPCVTEEDLNAIIHSIGRPEDFEEDDLAGAGVPENQPNAAHASERTHKPETEAGTSERNADPHYHKQLFRDENNKKLGGVCSGIANYFGIDPTIVRLITLVLFFTYGVGILIYIILWIAVPSSAVQVIGSSHRKLFRDISNKTIGGVCAGLASYFEVSIWVPKVIFILGAFSTFPLQVFFGHHFGGFFFPGINGFFITVYIILWVVVPPAVTASDRLSMKGENVDLNNIKSSVQEDLQDGKKKIMNPHGADPVMVTPNKHSTLGDFIILILKIFGYLILGSILIGIVAGLFTAGVALFSLSPLKDYVIGGYWQNIYALVAVILLIWLPVVGIIIWIIRRLIKAKSSKALRISFISLWLVGLIAGGLFLATLYRDFKFVNDPIPQQITLTNAKTEKLNVYLDKKASPYRFRRRWFVDDDMSVFFGDSTELNNTRLILRPSKSDSFSVSVMKFSNGNSVQDANQRASAIELDPIVQQGEQLNIPCSFNINKTTKFRNQFVLVTIGVPVGRKIEMHTNRGGYNNRFYLSMMGDGDWDDFNPEDFDGLYDYGDALNWDFDREYIMTKNGLEATDPDLDASKDRIKSAEEIIQEQQDKIKAEKERIEKSLQEDKDKLQKQIEQHQKELEEQLQRAKKALPETTGNASIDIKTPVMWIGKTLLRLS